MTPPHQTYAHRRIHSHAKRPLTLTAVIGTALALSSCIGDDLQTKLSPLQIEKQRGENSTVEIRSGNAGRVRDKTAASDGPSAPLGGTVATPFSSTEPPKLSGDKISVNFEGIRLPAFVNTVFGELLNVSFEIDNTVQQREQIVTFRNPEPVTPTAFLEIVRQILGNYGLAVTYQNSVYRIVESASLRQDIPRIVRSRALPSMPNDMRPVFYYAALSAIPASLMQSFLQQSLKDRLQYQSLPLANGLLLLGKAEDIEAAKETILVLDQPALAGNKSLKIEPAFWSADKLAQQLVDVLTAEGYSVSIGGNSNNAIKLVPVRALNTLVVFCADEKVMSHVLEWATELDKPGQTIETKGVYYHRVFNTKAKDIADVIDALLGAGVVGNSGLRSTTANAVMNTNTTSAASNLQNAAPGAPNLEQRATLESRKVIVDETRNALIFQGTAEEYSQFRTLVDQMDRSPLEVLIEATVAEVTLKEGETLSSVLSFDDGAAAAASRSSIKSDAGILVNFIRDTGKLTASFKALSDRSRVNILSSPRVVATSGKPASIQIGTQVPIITTQQQSPTGTVGGTTALLQDIQYRNTGVQLTISPTINSNRRLELQIQQEVSEAQVNNVSNVQSPLILTRSINTTLSMDDADTVLLGGLISENFSKTENGIPVLKDIPVLGNLFKTTGKGRNRTELIVLMTPYIIESSETARALRDAYRDQLTTIPRVIGSDSKAIAKPESK